jgi:hypothetical protein
MLGIFLIIGQNVVLKIHLTLINTTIFVSICLTNTTTTTITDFYICKLKAYRYRGRNRHPNYKEHPLVKFCPRSGDRR